VVSFELPERKEGWETHNRQEFSWFA